VTAVTYDFDPELAPIIELLPAGDLGDLEEMRTMVRSLTAGFEVDTTGVDVVDHGVPGPDGAPDVLVRTYRRADLDGPAPAVLDIHGGGFIVGDIDMEHAQAVELVRRLPIVVAAVEYRLAPEHPYPAGLDDCYAALAWLHAQASDLDIDPDRVALYGASAGGGLAAGLALLARDRQGPPVCFQFLAIPELDDRLETHSMRSYVDTPLWNRPNAERSWEMYLGGLAAADVPVYASPARATDLAGLPPAYISTMEFDPLRDEGIAYAVALLQAGVATELHSYPGTFHGSALVTTAQVSRRSAEESVTVLARALGVGVVA